MTRYRAAWVVPITQPPIRDGWVDVQHGQVVAVGPATDDRHPTAGVPPEIDLGPSAILPGLVNAHTHLELSGLRSQVPPTSSMPIWARRVMARTAHAAPDVPSIRAAIAEVTRSGTALVGDISNTLASVVPLRDAGVPAVVFKEVLGFNERDPSARVARLCAELAQPSTDSLRLRLAAHAPYSVSADLFVALRAAADEHELWPLSVHAAESREEIEFLRAGTGAWRDVLEERGRWDPQWRPSGEGPVRYLDDLGWLGAHTLLVHGVQFTDHELRLVAAAGATLVTCPRSNQWTGAGPPPLDRFYAQGVQVAVGTDSLASVDDLNLFAEIHEVRRLAPSIPARAILRSATFAGAEALGFGAELGRIAPGARAALISVQGVEVTDDVEEYLLSGILPEQVTWLDSWSEASA